VKLGARSIFLFATLTACSRSPGELSSQDSSQRAAASSTVATTAPSAAVSQSLGPTTFDVPTPLSPQPATTDVEPWNPKQIDWKSWDDGLALAKKQHKPICLTLFTTWCQHCKNYSHVFGDVRLVMMARSFVMIRLDADKETKVAKQYSPDGEYVPRTFILDSVGNINPKGNSDHPRYAHFFDEMHADSLIDAMDVSLGSEAERRGR
jgi:hypothetical protein